MWIFIAFIGIFAITVFVVRWLTSLPLVPGIHKKCVIITGCDSGFGNALAKSLYRRGVYVFAGCFTEEGAKRLSEETGERLKTLPLDVRDDTSVQSALEYVQRHLPANSVLWGLVNNAGIAGRAGPFEFVSRQDLRDVMEVNCFGMFEMMQTFLPLLKQSHGRVVNVASVAGKVPMPHMFPYTASKFALMAISESLRQEKARWGVRVSTVCPAFYRTNILQPETFRAARDETWAQLGAETQREYGKDYLDKFTEMTIQVAETSCTDLSPVITDLEHALFARWPRGVYFPGYEAKAIMTAQNFLPTFITDLIGYLYMGTLIPDALKK